MNVILITLEKVQDVIRKKRSVTLSHLISVTDASFNLIFLAIDRLSSEHKINIRREEADYILYIKDNERENFCLEKGGD
jgi:hypothetical protein